MSVWLYGDIILTSHPMSNWIESDDTTMMGATILLGAPAPTSETIEMILDQRVRLFSF